MNSQQTAAHVAAQNYILDDIDCAIESMNSLRDRLLRALEANHLSIDTRGTLRIHLQETTAMSRRLDLIKTEMCRS